MNNGFCDQEMHCSKSYNGTRACLTKAPNEVDRMAIESTMNFKCSRKRLTFSLTYFLLQQNVLFLMFKLI